MLPISTFISPITARNPSDFIQGPLLNHNSSEIMSRVCKFAELKWCKTLFIQFSQVVAAREKIENKCPSRKRKNAWTAGGTQLEPILSFKKTESNNLAVHATGRAFSTFRHWWPMHEKVQRGFF